MRTFNQWFSVQLSTLCVGRSLHGEKKVLEWHFCLVQILYKQVLLYNDDDDDDNDGYFTTVTSMVNASAAYDGNRSSIGDGTKDIPWYQGTTGKGNQFSFPSHHAQQLY